MSRGGNWCLYATCDIPEADIREPEGGFLGVDLGIANIAVTSEGTVHAGKHVNQVRHRNRRLRKRLQKKGTKSAKRLLRKLSGREARFAADTNHCISKKLVTEAERTCRGIALEDLGGIRERVRLRKPQRVTLHSWTTFLCMSCGFAEHADINAARDIAARGAADWAVSHAADDAA